MPQYFKISQRRLLFFFQDVRTRFRYMLSTHSGGCCPSIPITPKKWSACHRIAWSPSVGFGGQHASESLVTMTRNMHFDKPPQKNLCSHCGFPSEETVESMRTKIAQ